MGTECLVRCPSESEETLIHKKYWPNPNFIETLTLILFLAVVPCKWLNNSLVPAHFC